LPGAAELPLHGGHVPRWMLARMQRLTAAVVEALVDLRGPRALVAGLSDPFWFQAFNNLIGMDWDSSGSTTVLTGILKTITWSRPELGVLVLGGKGGRMRLVPEEAERAGELLGVDPEDVVRLSRAAARVDDALLQDGYRLYHHAVIVSAEGEAVVVQQGMNPDLRLARRYHLDRASVEEPHTGIAGRRGLALNLTDKASREARRVIVDLLAEPPSRLERLAAEAYRLASGARSIEDYLGPGRPGGGPRAPLWARVYKPVKPGPALRRALERLAREPPEGEEALLYTPGLGPAVVRALALIADLLYRAPASTRDPVTHPIEPYAYAYAVGGKDGVPYPFDARTAERAAEILEEALEAARLGEREKLRALLRLRRLLRGAGLEG
jgi:hypothetical protein